MRIVYDPVLMRPGCVLLQAGLGGTVPDFLELFDSDTWLVNLTPDLKVYEVTGEQVALLAKASKKRKERR